MNTRVLTLLRKYVKSLTTSVTIIKFFIENMPVLKAIKSLFKTHMIKRIVHSWSFHMKFIKHAEGSFKLISYEMTTSVRSSIYKNVQVCKIIHVCHFHIKADNFDFRTFWTQLFGC